MMIEKSILLLQTWAIYVNPTCLQPKKRKIQKIGILLI